MSDTPRTFTQMLTKEVEHLRKENTELRKALKEVLSSTSPFLRTLTAEAAVSDLEKIREIAGKVLRGVDDER